MKSKNISTGSMRCGAKWTATSRKRTAKAKPTYYRAPSSLPRCSHAAGTTGGRVGDGNLIDCGDGLAGVGALSMGAGGPAGTDIEAGGRTSCGGGFRTGDGQGTHCAGHGFQQVLK